MCRLSGAERGDELPTGSQAMGKTTSITAAKRRNSNRLNSDGIYIQKRRNYFPRIEHIEDVCHRHIERWENVKLSAAIDRRTRS